MGCESHVAENFVPSQRQQAEDLTAYKNKQCVHV